MDYQRIAQRVAKQHLDRLDKTAFNKENPSELLSQIIKLLDKASTTAEGPGRQGLQDALNKVKGITKPVQEAWSHRDDAE